MAGSINKVILIGNLGREPEIKNMQNGARVLNLSIATGESWKDKNTGERREKTEWHRVVIFNEGLIKIAERYLKKGSKVYLEGQLETRKWTDQSGTEKYTTEIVLRAYRGELTMLDARGGDGGGAYDNGGGYANNDQSQSGGGYQQQAAATSNAPTGAPPADDLEDEIPF